MELPFRMADDFDNNVIVQRFTRLRQSLKTPSLIGREWSLKNNAGQQERSESSHQEKFRACRLKLQSSFQGKKEETEKLVEQRKLLADQGHQLVEIKKQVEKLLRTSEQMAGRLTVLERVCGLGKNNVPMITDVKKTEENVLVNKRTATFEPLPEDNLQVVERSSFANSVEGGSGCSSPPGLLMDKPTVQNSPLINLKGTEVLLKKRLSPLVKPALKVNEKSSAVSLEDDKADCSTPSRPKISKPILQVATPCATSQIAKSPCTGVSQSSILAGTKEKASNTSKPLRRAVFRDQINLPSPDSPKKPPIIHQPSTSSLRTCVKQQRKFGTQRSSSLRCSRPSNPPPKPPEPLVNTSSSTTTNKPRSENAALKSDENCFSSNDVKSPADNSEPLYDTIWEEGEDQCSPNQRIENNSFEDDSDGNHVEPMNMTNPDHGAIGEDKTGEMRLDDDQLSQMRSSIGEDLLEVDEQKLVMGSSGDLLQMVQSELLAKPIYSNQK